MSIKHIHTYLVHPNKQSDTVTQINGTSVGLNGPLFRLLENIYRNSEAECNIDITFTHDLDGKQKNDCRDLILRYLEDSTLENGRQIAHRLEQYTDRRSALGLLFLITGKEGKDYKIVISRFPTDIAIYVDENTRKLTVEFLERVFMKNRTSYKAVVYQHSSLSAGIWCGRTVDKQLNSNSGELSNYWIVDFLASQISVTAAAGTLRLAKAVQNAAKSADIGVKREISAAVTLAPGLAGETLSINDFGERFNLSQEARDAISAEVKKPQLTEEQFEFDATEFQRINAFRLVELSNGAILMAASSEFADVFHQEIVNDGEGKVRFITEGKIVNEKLRTRS